MSRWWGILVCVMMLLACLPDPVDAGSCSVHCSDGSSASNDCPHGESCSCDCMGTFGQANCDSCSYKKQSDLTSTHSPQAKNSSPSFNTGRFETISTGSPLHGQAMDVQQHPDLGLNCQIAHFKLCMNQGSCISQCKQIGSQGWCWYPGNGECDCYYECDSCPWPAGCVRAEAEGAIDLNPEENLPHVEDDVDPAAEALTLAKPKKRSAWGIIADLGRQRAIELLPEKLAEELMRLPDRMEDWPTYSSLASFNQQLFRILVAQQKEKGHVSARGGCSGSCGFGNTCQDAGMGCYCSNGWCENCCNS